MIAGRWLTLSALILGEMLWHRGGRRSIIYSGGLVEGLLFFFRDIHSFLKLHRLNFCASLLRHLDVQLLPDPSYLGLINA